MRLKTNRQNRFGDFRFPRAGNLRALRVNRLEAKPSPRVQVPRTHRSASLPWGAVRTPRAEDGAGTAHAIPSAIPKQIPQFTFANEISLRNKVSTSYLFHNSQISEDKIELLVLLKNGSHISTSQRNAGFHVGTFRHEIAHVQEDVARCDGNVAGTCRAYTSPASFRIRPKGVFMCSVVLDRDGNGGGDGNARLRFGTVSAGGLQLIARAVLSTILHLYTAKCPTSRSDNGIWRCGFCSFAAHNT